MFYSGCAACYEAIIALVSRATRLEKLFRQSLRQEKQDRSEEKVRNVVDPPNLPGRNTAMNNSDVA
jgi:hypothetical protein